MPQGPGHRPPTVDDVARAAGVSRQTVSNALNAPARLRPETLQRVLVVVGELGYRPNRAARSLRRRESRLVGLHIRPPQPDQAGSVLDRFLHALAEHSARSGYHVLPFATGDAEEICAFNELLGTTAVDAFVLTDTHRADGRVRWLLCRDAPFVAFGRPWDDGPPHAWVDVDGAAGIAMVVDHLVRRGHRRIGYIGWGEASELGNDRRSGWVTAGRRHGLDNADLEIRSVDRIADGADGASHLMDRDDPPTALVCASDTLAMGALRALDIRGMGPGRDVAVTGFDDTPTAAALPVGLTSVRQPLEDVAAAIVKRLDAVLSGADVSDNGELLTPTLVVRGTS
jgi:DNA-binding LacI/PurR family transcriptional regulator